jgi:hypothetical protein
MNKRDFSVIFTAWGRLRVAGLAWLLMVCLAGAARVQAAPAVLEPFTVDAKTTTCLGLRVAASGAENLVVGWATGDAARGICFRQRLNLLWEAVRQVGGTLGEQPRDLDMAFDRLGRLNLVWTALDGRTRKVFYARLNTPGETPQAAMLLTPDAVATPGQAGDADFPALSPDAEGGMVVVWQESREMRFCIRAARILALGGAEDLGLVSGNGQSGAEPFTSGMAPQVLTTSPALQVAWYEISEAGSELRIDEWNQAERRWRPSAAEWDARLFPRTAQVLLGKTATGMMACWQEVQSDGHNAIRLGLAAHATPTTTATVTTRVLADPPGEHTRPSLAGGLPGRLTLAWQALAQGQQWIRIAGLTRPDQIPQLATVSPARQRFAAMPDHVTLGNWSAVVWTDDVHEGGRGGIYFSELRWPNQ